MTDIQREAVERIKVLACPQKFEYEGDLLVVARGLNPVTVDLFVEKLDIVLADEDSEAHAWLNRDGEYVEQLWAMLKQDFPANLEGYDL